MCMESNGILSDRTNKISDIVDFGERMVTLEEPVNQSPKTRPLPVFFVEQTTFSTKKEKNTPKYVNILPPKPPIKSCPPISRIKPLRQNDDGAKVISFAKNNTINKTSFKYSDIFF